MSFVSLTKLWIWISVIAASSGWLLSILGQLNRAGYLVIFLAVGLGAFLAGKVLAVERSGSTVGTRRGCWRKLFRRLRKPLPMCFALLALLIFLGGVIYAPTNHAGLTYRVPRVLQWLSEGHWFWIHTPNYRMNDRATGMEWLEAPLMLFSGSDRLLFLLNFIPYLLLPGLVFSVFVRLGVRGRVAWWWMWLLPMGYSFLLQAGGIANDTFPAVYAVAAVDFALRACRSRKFGDLVLSVLSAALLTGAKASNLPLLLPWAIAVLPVAHLVRRRPVASLVVCLLAAVVSFLPTAALNVFYCGDWSGLRLERAGMGMKDPVVGLWGNALLLLLHNFIPPVFPFAGWWNQSALTVFPQAIVAPLQANFEPGFQTVWELATEDWVGLGFGVSVLLLYSTLAGWRARSAVQGQGVGDQSIPVWVRRGVLVGAWLALGAYCVKSGMVMGSRLISPYYPLLIPGLLVGARQSGVVRSLRWRVLAWGSVLVAFLVLALAPARPLWPALTVLSKLHSSNPGNGTIGRALNVYRVYRERSDPMATVRNLLPADLTVVGFMADGDDLDISLWRPFFSRRVEHILISDQVQDIRARGIVYAVVGGAHLKACGVALESWLRETGAERLATVTVTLKAAEGPQSWHVVRFQNP